MNKNNCEEKRIEDSEISCIMKSFLIIATIIVAAAGNYKVSSAVECSGIWAANAKSSFTAPDFIPIKVPAPNKKVSIIATADKLLFVDETKQQVKLNVIMTPSLIETLWAPNSKQFVINVSDGGLVGSWDAKFYSIGRDGHLISHNIQKKIRSIARKYLKCDPQEDANIGAIAWLNNGREILIIAEVPPHSSCKNMGDIRGFRVSFPSGRILERISEHDLRRKWEHVLGCRFIKTDNK